MMWLTGVHKHGVTEFCGFATIMCGSTVCDLICVTVGGICNIIRASRFLVLPLSYAFITDNSPTY